MPAILSTIIGPNERAGLIPHPVNGTRIMWHKVTDHPMAIGAALPAVDLELTAEFRTVITKRKVPINSSKNAQPMETVSPTWLRPKLKAGPNPPSDCKLAPHTPSSPLSHWPVREAKHPHTMKEPKIAPMNWAAMYRTPLTMDCSPKTTKARVTAGLMWPPEMWPIPYARTEMPKPKAMAIVIYIF